jgi:trans-2,3-dihydro-3-hydroxyanthranilate isomerase
MSYRFFFTCDVFTDRRFGGNPLAVLPDARGLDDRLMQTIAREFNLSETVFVLPPDNPRHTARLRIFTPAAELPFAGHPTVGAAFVLATTGAIGADEREIVFEETIGPVPVEIERVGGVVARCTLTAARSPERGPPPPARARLAAMLSLAVNDLAEPAECWSCGTPFLVIPLASVAALERCRLDAPLCHSLLDGYATQHVYPVARVAATNWRVRMFAPALGVGEDPATGSAAAAFAGWLARHDATAATSFELQQGAEIGRPSLLRLQFDRTATGAGRVRVGGSAVMVSTGSIDC